MISGILIDFLHDLYYNKAITYRYDPVKRKGRVAMSLHLLRADMTKLRCDAMVIPSNTSLMSGGSVFGAASSAAGPGFFEECQTLGGCAVGEAKRTRAYGLPCEFVIVTAAPVWKGGSAGETEQLSACYRNSLALARESGCKTVAFGLIDSGIYGYPPEVALQTATDTIRAYLERHDMTVYLVVFDWNAYNGRSGGFHALKNYIDKHYTGDVQRSVAFHAAQPVAANADEAVKPVRQKKSLFRTFSLAPSLAEAVRQLDESFSEMLLRKIDESGMTDAQCYKKAGIDRRLFSKIRSDAHYKPKKTTVIAFAIALELSLEETQEMLKKAGYTLSHSNRFDIIIEYFILHENYDIFEINEALYSFDQMLLGSNA